MRIEHLGTANRTRKGRRRYLALAVAALTTVAVPMAAMSAYGAGSATATAKHPNTAPDPEMQAFIRAVGARAVDNQDALSQLRAWMLQRPGFSGSGYVGSIDDLARRSTTVMWYGPRTALLSAIVAEGARRGIAVSVQPRSHSLQQLRAATDTVWRQAATGGWAGFKISAIAAVGAVDDGLTIYGTYSAGATSQRAPQVRSLSTSVLGVPAHVVAGVSAGSSTGRDNDFSPFDAGGYMISPSSGHTCSTGFGINLNGTSRITTARHCIYNDYRDRAASNTYGTGITNSRDGGGRVLSAHAVALALDGPYNSDGFSKFVIGYEDLAVGNYVCTGGGNSGEHCNVKVTNLVVSFNDGQGTFSTIEGVQQTSGKIAQIQGDSGGPVISLANTSSGQVRASGMIQGFLGTGSTGSACGPVYDAGSNRCTANVLFSSMRTVINNISGASLLVS